MADQEIEVRRTAPSPAPTRASGSDLFQSFRNEMDRLFDQFWRGSWFGAPSLRAGKSGDRSRKSCPGSRQHEAKLASASQRLETAALERAGAGPGEQVGLTVESRD